MNNGNGGRRCKICGKMLSESNSNDHCWHHDVKPENEEPLDYCLCHGRDTSAFDRVQMDYHGNLGMGLFHH